MKLLNISIYVKVGYKEHKKSVLEGQKMIQEKRISVHRLFKENVTKNNQECRCLFMSVLCQEYLTDLSSGFEINNPPPQTSIGRNEVWT